MSKTIINFILKSSADPTKTSATIKFALLGIIPFIMQAWGIVCEFGYECTLVDTTLLEAVFNLISQTVFFSLSLISIIGTIWALFRKVSRTVGGTNKAL